MNIKELLGDGYQDGMSAEELMSALEAIDIDDGSAEITRLKNALTKSNSEAANYKKQLREKQTEDEKNAAEQRDAQEALQKAYNELKRETDISKNLAKFVSMGYAEDLAKETAEALVDGKMDVVFTNQQKHLKEFEKNIRAEVIKDTPKPDGGTNGNNGMTLDKFRAMTSAERYQYSVDHPDDYNTLYKGEKE